ncbi:MAG: bifunctional glutamate N-acetyltransferase/amino-acid acetyltransferase ArgJ [Planctomycetes bacterium]|nr:bifunctional glutamate N-acetyltransferase/amino-acid acetyltransferase ArgJ [Planctomycetota bacterium]
MATKKAIKKHAVQDWPGGQVNQVAGFRTATLHCGLKSKAEKPDLALLVCDADAAAAGVFTTNLVHAAPVRVSKAALKTSKGKARAVIVNSGNANACTGAQGDRDAESMARLTAKGLGCTPAGVLVCSTGIIGRQLPMEKVARGIAELSSRIKSKGEQGDFARAIMTTDLVPKTAAVTAEIDGAQVRVAGACKGSGMIAPRMATMLGFVATDAALAPKALQAVLADVAEETFNCVTVDGDTSTNDTLFCLASGRAEHPAIKSAKGPAYEAFREALYVVCDSLAKQIASDGEGAQHTITLYVGGAKNDAHAKLIGRAVAESPLVKTAIAGCDPNWGRIMAAAGRSGGTFDPAESSLTVQGFELFRGGTPTEFDGAQVSDALKNREVSIVLMVGNGPGRAKFYTCDLTHGYIEVNADYHT